MASRAIIAIVWIVVIIALLYVAVPRDLLQPSLDPAVASAPREKTAADTPSAPTRPKLDAGAWLACRKFEPLARDANAGLLTNAEFRDGLKDVRSDAATWPNSAVSMASAELLRTLTIGGTTEAMKAQFLALVDACRDWEHRQ